MLNEKTLQNADLYFRTFLHTTTPLHQCIVDEMCVSNNPPLELATRLEDIGHAYIGMALKLARTLIDQGRTALEPDPDDFAEARISQFAEAVIDGSGELVLEGGIRVNGRAALAGLPVVSEAIKTALWIARAGEIERRQAEA